MKKLIVQSSSDGITFTNTTNNCKTLADVELNLIQLEWIDPHIAWRAIKIENDEIKSIGKTDYSTGKGKVIWKDL